MINISISCHRILHPESTNKLAMDLAFWRVCRASKHHVIINFYKKKEILQEAKTSVRLTYEQRCQFYVILR